LPTTGQWQWTKLHAKTGADAIGDTDNVEVQVENPATTASGCQ
jgi:hypothetical protein